MQVGSERSGGQIMQPNSGQRPTAGQHCGAARPSTTSWGISGVLPLAAAASSQSSQVTAWTQAVGRLRQIADTLALSIPNIVLGLIVLILFNIAGIVLRRGIRRFATVRRRRTQNLAIILGRVAHGLAMLVGVLVASVIVFPHFTVASMVQFLGIGSVAAGFAFRDVLQNYLAGMLLLLTEPFQVGDQIIYQTYEGTVEDIQTRATLLRTYDGRRIVIPNAELFTQPVTVNTAFEKRRIQYELSIGYGDDIDKAKRLVLDSLARIEEVLPKPPPQVFVQEFAASSVVMRLQWWIKPPRIGIAYQSRDKVLTAIKQTLVENGIDLPYATHVLLFHDQTDETDGDRRRQREGWPAGQGDVPRLQSIASALLRRMRRDSPDAHNDTSEDAP